MAAKLVIIRNDHPYSNPIREATIDSGKIRGTAGNNHTVTVFKGIPFAKPPVGELRFAKPQPVEPWEGVRDCIEFGPAAFQLDRSYEAGNGAKDLYPAPYKISEDCLYLNVWTPAQSTDEKLPVYFWTHGGGNFGGFGHEMENDGEGLAKRGVILVTYNYRLNCFGFLAHPELSKENGGTSGNWAVYDAAMALDWVRRNISAFGGDPDNITIGGQSAGCSMTMSLAVSPLARGKYSKITYHSSVRIGKDGLDAKEALAEMEEAGVKFMKAHGCNSIAELRALPAEKLMEETEFEREFGLFRQFPDGVIIPKNVGEMLENGEYDDVPTLTCGTADEFLEDGQKRQTVSKGVKAFCENQIKLGRKPVYAFRFSRDLPGDDEGAWHTSELFYLFETVYRSWRPMRGYDYDISHMMADYWANFIKTGDPNGDGLPTWKPYTAESKKCMDLGTNDCMIDIK